jgi:hypothetical protein
MITITPQMRILLAVEPVDFRNHSERLIIPSRDPKALKPSDFWGNRPFWLEIIRGFEGKPAVGHQADSDLALPATGGFWLTPVL